MTPLGIEPASHRYHHTVTLCHEATLFQQYPK